jgi:uncharacterized RDD family membrane protein YckC
MITSPEGVLLSVRLASRGERIFAFALDATFMLAAVILVYIILAMALRSRVTLRSGVTLFNFLAFVIRMMYFTHFELAWQGRTPGKRICGIRVIDRSGGPLTPTAIIARNLMREVEFFLPAVYLLQSAAGGGWSALFTLGWTALFTALPFFNRDNLRPGDFIAGTMVIVMPKRYLCVDLSSREVASGGEAGYSFTAEQLAIYGEFELQILEELLRRPKSADNDRLLRDVAAKICRRIGLQDEIPERGIRRFLNDFYSAERASLEHGKLFGHTKDDKNS